MKPTLIHRISAKAFVIHQNQLLLIKKTGVEGEYYILPGGGQERTFAGAPSRLRPDRSGMGSA